MTQPHRPRRRNRACSRAIEALEPRVFLALSAAGAEFLVNLYTTGGQTNPVMAMDAHGDFVAVWESFGQDGSLGGIFAQRFNAAGVGQGAEFQVNTDAASVQIAPAVAMDADGDFVIVWNSDSDGDAGAIFAQRYNNVGLPQGGEFRVNSTTVGSQRAATVAMDATGDFVIAWGGRQEGAVNYGIYAQRYNHAGVPQGGEFHVNTYTTNQQYDPAVAMDAVGNFAIAWYSIDQEGAGSEHGVYVQRFDSAGAPLGSEFRANTHTTSRQNTPAIAMDANGDFVVAWQSLGQDEAGNYGVYAQRFNAGGVAQGLEFRANAFVTGLQGKPAVAMNAAGSFVLSWESFAQEGAGSQFGVYARMYDAAGTPLSPPSGAPVGSGNEFRANTFTTASQAAAAVAMDSKGDLVIGWAGNGTGDTGGIYAQRYDTPAVPVITGVFVNGTLATPYGVVGGPAGQVVVAFSEDVLSTGPNSVTHPAKWRVTHNNGGAIGNVSIQGVSYDFNPATHRYEATLFMPASFASGNLQVIAFDSIRDAADNPLDGNFDGAPGGYYSLTFGIDGTSQGQGEFRVNTFTPGSQLDPAIAIRSDGDFVVAWRSDGQDGNGFGIYAQRYDGAGAPQDAEFRVNSFTTGDQSFAAMDSDADGDFVVAWESEGQDGSENGIYAQRYSAAGAPQGGEFRVNNYTTDNQSRPKVAMEHNGDFVITWHSRGQDGNEFGVYARRYSAAGAALGAEFQVNSYTTGWQYFADVAMDADGDFVIAWTDDERDRVFAQRYNASGIAQGTEFVVGQFFVDDTRIPAIAMDDDGDFVIAWWSLDTDGDHYGIYAQRYNAAAAQQGGFFRVNSFTTGRQLSQHIGMNANGDFVIAWHSQGQDGSTYGIYAQQYSAAGLRQGGEFRVNTVTLGGQNSPAVGMDVDGDFVVTWLSNNQDHSGTGIYAQRYVPSVAPTVGALSASPSPAIPGASVTLTASGVTDDMFALSVHFYREANGIAGLQFGPGGDTLIATDENGGDGWTASVPTASLAPATYLYYAQAVDDEGMVGAPATTSHTVLAAAPSVLAANFLYQTYPQKLTFTFDQDVSASLGAGDFGNAGVPGVDYAVSYNATTNTATLTFASPFADGNHTITVLAAGVSGTGGTPMSSNYAAPFFALAGDANHDRKVDIYDLRILSANFNGSGKTFPEGDFNYDSFVNTADLTILAGKWQQTLAAPAPPLPTAISRAPVRRPVQRVGLLTD